MTVRRRVNAFFRKHFLPIPSSADSPPGPSTPAHSSPSISRRSTNHGDAPLVTVRSHHPPSGITVADRPVDQPRTTMTNTTGRSGRRRRRRRTSSPVGLPLYSKDPGEEEMSLFKSEVDLTLDPYETREGEGGEEEDDGQSSDEDDDGADEEVDNVYDDSIRPSFDASTNAGDHASSRRSSTLLTPPNFLGNRPRSASAPLAHLSSPLSSSPQQSLTLSRYISHSPGSSSPFASRTGLIDLPVNNLESPGISPPSSPPPTGASSNPPVSLHRYTHRPSASSPANTASLSPPSPSHSPTNSIGIGRPRSSTLQRILGSHSRNASSSSLAPPVETGRSPYGQFAGGGGNGSTARLASGSNASLSTLSISAPLPNSFVHSSFVFPRSGPTPQQVAFISSRESLGAYGYGAGVARESPFSSPPTFDAAISQTSLALSPDSPPQRPASAVIQGRGRSASSASRMSSSPLARVETLDEMPSGPPPATERRRSSVAQPLPLPTAVRMAEQRAEAEPRAGEEDEEKDRPPAPLSLPSTPSSPSPSSTPLSDPLSSPPTRRPSLPALELNLSLPSLPSFSPLATSSLNSPSTPSAPPPPLAYSHATSPPPVIMTLAPTPTGSAAPSPMIGSGPCEGKGGEGYFFPSSIAGGQEEELFSSPSDLNGRVRPREESTMSGLSQATARPGLGLVGRQETTLSSVSSESESGVGFGVYEEERR
ncbi:hypothetical protein JCM8547_008244 [Rhodosporidiobolus lusitaniae]